MLKTVKKVQSGFTIIELLIVIAIIGILAGLVLNNFQGAQAKSRDVQRKTRINSIHGKLEEYYNNNGGYPDGALSTTVLPGIDAQALNDAAGTAMGYTGGFIVSATTPAVTVTNAVQFNYQAYSCTTAGAQATVGATCAKYQLSTFQEKAATYTKSSLN